MDQETDYQSSFSKQFNYVFDSESRERKALTILKVLQNYCGTNLVTAEILSVGASTGIIENYLAAHCKSILGVDVDANAIHYAQHNFNKKNLSFEVKDILTYRYPSAQFDIILCNHIYEHVPDAQLLMDEIHRLLKPNGFCYFAAENRLLLKEPHHNLFFLSVLPRFLSHFYMRLAGKGNFYYENLMTYWTLRKLVRNFELVDYSVKIIDSPEAFAADTILPPNSLKQSVAHFMIHNLYWLSPTYIWILKKKV